MKLQWQVILTPVIFAYWTTSGFEQSAKAYARSIGLWHMDGQTLAAYVGSLGLVDAVMRLPDVVAPSAVSQESTGA
jgi:hypothetical protein